MQVLLLALSILLMTILAGNGRLASKAGQGNVVMKIYKPTEKEAWLALPGERLSVYSSRFDVFVY